MKKIILSAAALFAFGFANAQDLKFGAKAGVNFANLSTNYSSLDETSENTMKIGFHVGGLVEIKFSEKFALQPELLYSAQGTTTESSSNDFGFGSSSSESKLSLGYINVPIMVKFYPIEKLFIEAGPQVGFLISAKEKSEGTTTITYTNGEGMEVTETESFDTETDMKDFYKSIDFGINFGVGYEFTENLFANVRYNLGLSNIAEEPEIDGFDEFEEFDAFFEAFDEKNRVIQLSIGYKF
jgi:hypothetical protein